VASEHLPQPGDGLAGEFVGACRGIPVARTWSSGGVTNKPIGMEVKPIGMEVKPAIVE